MSYLALSLVLAAVAYASGFGAWSLLFPAAVIVYNRFYATREGRHGRHW